MATRKIKDAKDTTTNEVIYFKGHAKATYMSDGRSVEDAIYSIGSGGGEGGITQESDPLFRASAAAGITEDNIEAWNNKVDKVTLASVATSGNYNDLSNKPTIPTTLSQLTQSASYRTVTDTEKSTWGGKQDKLVSGTNLKTINGESLLGSGDIAISSGGDGVSAYPKVNHGTSDTTFELTPNTFHMWGIVSSLTLTFGSETSGVANEYLFQFSCLSSAATMLSLPSSVIWADGEAPTIEVMKTYQVSILNNCATIQSFG